MKRLLFLIVLFPILSYGASTRHIDGNGISKTDSSALDQNFQNITNELISIVHKSSTETITGFKYFVNPVDFGTITADSGTITNFTATTGTISNIVSSSIGTNQIAYNNGTKLVGSSSMTFNGSTVALTVPLDMNSHKVVNLTNGSASSDVAAFGQIPVVAAQSDQETGTSNTVFVSPGTQKYNPSSPKAWVIFQGTGTVTILASYNVSSITDNGTGDYTVNFTTAFSTANYATLAWGDVAINSVNAPRTVQIVSVTASAFRINTVDNASALEDWQRVNLVFYGDQ